MMRALIALGAAATLAACSQGAPEGGATAGSDQPAAASLFASEIAPTLAGACATCHMTGREAGNMALVPGKALEYLVNVDATEAPGLKRVVPGKPDESYLVMKLEGTHLEHGGSGAQMPFGAPPLPPEVIAKFREWIEQGAEP